MQNIGLILMVFGFVFFCIAARGIGPPPWSLGWLGLACWILAEIIAGATKVFH
jgi:hypothetical protein